MAITIFNTAPITAQNISSNQLSNIDVDSLSDDQVLSYWEKAKSEGYSIEQISFFAASKGMSSNQVSKLKQRISGLRYSLISPSSASSTVAVASDQVSSLEKFGLEGKASDKMKKSLLFGYDFFSNPNISFSPNLNVATPTTYQVGPGDELLIDIWGAAQNNYRQKIDKQGFIHIENIGPIYVSGLSIDKARVKIISYLQKIYSGIGVLNSSPLKVFAAISLSEVRTVQVNIIGEVKVPGTYSLSALSTVLNALYAAGGPTETGTFREIRLIREGNLYSEFDIYKYLIEGSEKGNSFLKDQDVLIVKPYISKVEVTGEVKRQGLYELKGKETIKDLIHYFGGFTAEAFKERLSIERVNGTQKEVIEASLTSKASFVLKDGDKLEVGKVIDRFENRVMISGAVFRPGVYELTPAMTLSDLIEKAAGPKDDAFLDRGIIYRYIDEVKKEIVPFSLNKVLEGAIKIPLKREDVVEVFSKQSLEDRFTVSIVGAVNNPKKIDFYEKTTVEDLVAIAGGFKEGADVSRIDISRRLADGSFETISEDFTYLSSANLSLKPKPFYLEPFDIVYIRHIKGYMPQKNAEIRGEVARPGNYSIRNKNERVSDLIQKAGGISPYAYIKGASIIRKVTDKSIEFLKEKALEEILEKDSLVSDLEDRNHFRIGIDLGKILGKGGKESTYDLLLQEGDILTIPTIKQTVEITGAVLAPSLVQYKKSKSLKDYIHNSGGFSNLAQRKKAYVISANGDIAVTRSFLFFKFYPEVAPGATILVPEKERREKTSVQEWVGISSALTTLALLIKSF